MVIHAGFFCCFLYLRCLLAKLASTSFTLATPFRSIPWRFLRRSLELELLESIPWTAKWRRSTPSLISLNGLVPRNLLWKQCSKHWVVASRKSGTSSPSMPRTGTTPWPPFVLKDPMEHVTCLPSSAVSSQWCGASPAFACRSLPTMRAVPVVGPLQLPWPSLARQLLRLFQWQSRALSYPFSSTLRWIRNLCDSLGFRSVPCTPSTQGLWSRTYRGHRAHH